MEAVPRLPMVSFDLKLCADRPQTDFSKLKQYIKDFFNENPEGYSIEFRNLESLRSQAVRPVKDINGLSILKKYYCQLHFLQSRFPMERGGLAAVSFSWRDTYSSSVTTSPDIKYEMVVILYNIGALHTQLGASYDRTAPDGLKMACTHFQCAAWAFQHIKDSFPQPAGMDLSPDVMHFMYHLCLAQAQECILEKSMTDNRKATINAKVATQIVDYYNMAYAALTQQPEDPSTAISETVGSKVMKSWKRYVKFKSTYCSSISLLYLGMQSEEQQKMGERVAFYQAAMDKLAEAIKLSRSIDQVDGIDECMMFTRDVVEGKRQAAKSENNFIYHEEVPDIDTLPTVKGATLVKGISFSVTDPDISGPDIFSKLIPLKAHQASSMYSEEKAKLLRKINVEIDAKDEEVVSFMSCLQLDQIRAHLTASHLPQEVVDRCAALSANPDAIPNLISAMDHLSDAYHDVDGMLQEIMVLIKTEEAAEAAYQEVMGKRGPSIVATDLTREANKYMEAHKKAAESNDTLNRAMSQHIENLRVLNQPLDSLQSKLPSLEALNLGDDETLKEVSMLVGKVEEMRKQRAMLASQLRESITSDDITVLLVTSSEDNLQQIFTQELQKHDKYVKLIEQNLAAQENIITALTNAYAAYGSTRKATAEIMRQRETMLSALISSYDAYEDLLAKSAKGLEFYRKLETNLTKLLQRVKGTCKVQQEEREAILTRNNVTIPSGTDDFSASNQPAGPKLKDYLAKRKEGIGNMPGSGWGVRPTPVGSEVNAAGAKMDGSVMLSYNVSSLQYPSLGSDHSHDATAPVERPDSLSDQPFRTQVVPGASYTGPYGTNTVTSPQAGYFTSQIYNSAMSSVSTDKSNHTAVLPSGISSTPQVEGPEPPFSPPKVNQPPTTTYTVQSTNPYHTSAPSSSATPNQQQATPLQSYSSYYQNYYQQFHSKPANYPYNQQPSPTPSPMPAYSAYPSHEMRQPSSSVPVSSATNATSMTSAYSAGSQQQPYSTFQQVVPGPPSGLNQIPAQNVPSASPGVNQIPSQVAPSASPSINQIPSQTVLGPSTGLDQLPSQVVPGSSQTLNQLPSQVSHGSSPGVNQLPSQVVPGASPTVNQLPSQVPSVAPQPPVPYVSPVFSNKAATVPSNYVQNPGMPSVSLTGQTAVNYSSSGPTSGLVVPGYSINQASPVGYTVSQPQQTNTPTSYLPVSSSGNYCANPVSVSPVGYSNVPTTSNYTIPTSVAGAGSYVTPNSGVQNNFVPSPYPTNYPSNPSQAFLPANQSSSLDAMKQNPNYLPGSQVPVSAVQSNPAGSYGNINHNTGTYPTGNLIPPANYSNPVSPVNYSGGYQANPANYSGSVHPSGINYKTNQANYVPNYHSTTQPAYGPAQVNTNTVEPVNYQISNQSSVTPAGYQYNASYSGYPAANSGVYPANYGAGYYNYQNVSVANQPSTAAASSQPDTQPPANPSSSNIDLLAGLDFDVSEAPLKPDMSESFTSLSLTPQPLQESDSNKNIDSKDDVNKQSKSNSDKVIEDDIKPSVPPAELIPSYPTPSNTQSPSKDPLSDPEVLNQFIQEVEKFEKFVEGLCEKTLSGPTPLDLKWNELQDLLEKGPHKQNISVARCYPMKNRYPDFLPYDNSRVALPSTKDDYINASFVKSTVFGVPDMILTQTPLPSTYADFWTMVMEQHVELIVCLLNDSQLEGCLYWANSKTEDLILSGSGIKVTLESCNIRTSWIERCMSVTFNESSRIIVHLQFSAWPNRWVGSDGCSPWLSLVTEAMSVWRGSRSRHAPILVHCDAGVGRSGLFGLTCFLMTSLLSSPKIPDISAAILSLAEARKNPLRDRDHLKLAYQILLYHCQDMLMKRGILSCKGSNFDEKRPTKSKSHTRHPSQDFLLNSSSVSERRLSSQSDAGSTSSGKGGNTEPDPLSQLDPLWSLKKQS